MVRASFSQSRTLIEGVRVCELLVHGWRFRVKTRDASRDSSVGGNADISHGPDIPKIDPAALNIAAPPTFQRRRGREWRPQDLLGTRKKPDLGAVP
eukprot:5717041-Alexandrium_andersonii.AAC.1